MNWQHTHIKIFSAETPVLINGFSNIQRSDQPDRVKGSSDCMLLQQEVM